MTNSKLKRDELCDLLDCVITTRSNIYHRAKDLIKRLLVVYRVGGNEDILKDIRFLITESSIKGSKFWEIEHKWL